VSRLRWLPPAIWAALILFLTSVPDPGALAPVSAFSFPGADKLVHCLMYLVLGWLASRALENASISRVVWMAVAILCFAALDEWHQFFIPGRDADVLDWVADSLGASMGILLGARALRLPRYS
jgi:hypothetical protein